MLVMVPSRSFGCLRVYGSLDDAPGARDCGGVGVYGVISWILIAPFQPCADEPARNSNGLEAPALDVEKSHAVPYFHRPVPREPTRSPLCGLYL